MSLVAPAVTPPADQPALPEPDHASDIALQSAFAAASLQGSSQTANGTDGSGTAHPNVFVRGLPLAWSEAEMTAVFQQYGQLTSIRLVRHSVTKQSLGYGFVRYQEPHEAQASIAGLDGNSILGHTLQVKFADADAGPPSSGAPSGLTPCDSCYIKHLPATFGVAEVQQLFEPHGTVLDVKLFPCLDQFRGASALVRMGSVDSADRAINSLNNTTLPNTVQSLIVRYAESPAEKSARLNRRERQQLVQRNGLGLSGSMMQQAMSGLEQAQLQQALAQLGLNNLPLVQANGLASAMSLPEPMPLQPQHMDVPTYTGTVQSSICVKGVPSNADRLWMYEHFAKFGAVIGLRILIDEATGLCNGTGFVSYGEVAAADKAQQALHGVLVGEFPLSISVQQHPRPGQGGMPDGISNGGGMPQDWNQMHRQRTAPQLW